MSNLSWLSQTKTVDVLIFLADKKEARFGDIHQYTKGSYGTLNKAIDALKNAGLVDERKEPNIGPDGRKIVGFTRYIWLTDKGKKVAEYLIEMEKIMKEK